MFIEQPSAARDGGRPPIQCPPADGASLPLVPASRAVDDRDGRHQVHEPLFACLKLNDDEVLAVVGKPRESMAAAGLPSVNVPQMAFQLTGLKARPHLAVNTGAGPGCPRAPKIVSCPRSEARTPILPHAPRRPHPTLQMAAHMAEEPKSVPHDCVPVLVPQVAEQLVKEPLLVPQRFEQLIEVLSLSAGFSCSCAADGKKHSFEMPHFSPVLFLFVCRRWTNSWWKHRHR